MGERLTVNGRVQGVIVACQRVDGRWLLIRRSRHVAAPGRVCFPGGAIELGETVRTAAIREMQEELGVQVMPRAELWRRTVPQRPVDLVGVVADLTDPDAVRPSDAEVAEVLWMTGRQVRTHPDVMPYTDEFIAAAERYTGTQRHDRARS